MGRPSDYTDEIALTICTRLVDGQSLRAICREEGMPDRGTVFRWLETHEGFRSQYARAREAQAETFADELLEISDDASNDWMERNDKDNPGWIANGEHINRSRLRVDTRKWVASKLKPKKYGDKLAIGGGDEPIQVKSHVTHASAAALQRVGELLTRATTIGSPGEDSAPHPNGSVLPAAIRAGAGGHGTPVAPGENPGSPE